jgi:type III secretion system low calcium response chaperone LcrH/SycD
MSTATEETTPEQEKLAEEKLTRAIEDVVLNGKPVWQICGWKEDQIEGLYAMGYHYFEAGAYEEALKVFKPLVLLDSASARNWTALGAVTQMTGAYESALESFGYAAALDPENPRPFFNALECHIALKNHAKAKEAAEYILAIASGKPEHAALLARAKVFLAALEAKSQN